MPCGTGKSLTAYWIAEALKAKTILVAVPSLALVRQSLADWTREFLARNILPDWLCVCSNESVGNLERDEFVGEVYDLGLLTHTDTNEIAALLRARSNGHKIVFTTYQSSDKLAAAARKARIKFDLAILDEAHKTVGVHSKRFANTGRSYTRLGRLRELYGAERRFTGIGVFGARRRKGARRTVFLRAQSGGESTTSIGTMTRSRAIFLIDSKHRSSIILSSTDGIKPAEIDIFVRTHCATS
jgi:hypothetical protein